MGMASVQTQLEVQIREHIAKYYEGWTVCDDATCGNRTRMMGVYGRRCLRPGCQGSVAFEVSFRFLPDFVWVSPLMRRCAVLGRTAVQPAAILHITVRHRKSIERRNWSNKAG